MSLTGLILAAGNGKRMNSSIPKVLHSLDGKPMLERVLNILKKIPCEHIGVVLNKNHGPFDQFLKTHPELLACLQLDTNGTGGAVASAAPIFADISELPFSKGRLLKGEALKSKYVLICAGDTPVLDIEVLKDFIKDCTEKTSKLAILGMEIPNPTGYGRLCLNKEKTHLESIVEEKDASEDLKKIRVCNSGLIFADISYLFDLLGEVENRNQQGEYYLTDVVAISRKRGLLADVFVTEKWESFQGVNTPEQLRKLEDLIKKGT